MHDDLILPDPTPPTEEVQVPRVSKIRAWLRPSSDIKQTDYVLSFIVFIFLPVFSTLIKHC
jgi:hypothetical protein